jgi:hypothetical protein
MKSPNRARFLIAALAGALPVAQSRADPIPAALRGNSVVLSWSDFVTWKDDEDNVKNKSDTVAVKLYVSNQDRIFSSYELRRPHKHKVTGDSPIDEVSGVDEKKLHWKFEGGALIADENFWKNGARRLIVSFTDDFKQCSLDVFVAKKAGSPQVKHAGRSLGEIAISAKTCSLQPGNIFANSGSSL